MTTTVLAALAVLAAHPFADEYVTPPARAAAAVSGQIRLFAGPAAEAGVRLSPASGAAAPVRPLAGAGLGLTWEWMANVWVSLRTSFFGLAGSPAASSRLTLRTGPGLHLVSNRRVGVSLYVEGGISGVDLHAPTRQAAPELSPGLAVDVALLPALLLRVQGEIPWLVTPVTGASLLSARLTVAAGYSF